MPNMAHRDLLVNKCIKLTERQAYRSQILSTLLRGDTHQNTYHATHGRESSQTAPRSGAGRPPKRKHHTRIGGGSEINFSISILNETNDDAGHQRIGDHRRPWTLTSPGKSPVHCRSLWWEYDFRWSDGRESRPPKLTGRNGTGSCYFTAVVCEGVTLPIERA
ncbi:hypothetical protein EVAR_48560_1 [Eumeta japonica]|uniref:Uncharacterized protein n=1 Tax=Eumeta variegata TaxID=151549 RepID=A0A4C1Y803_EUMVA|nr:hypothetical protein EVAR_48560_1 [Eumeta japonica]